MTLNYMEILIKLALGLLSRLFCYQCDREGEPST